MFAREQTFYKIPFRCSGEPARYNTTGLFFLLQGRRSERMLTFMLKPRH